MTAKKPINKTEYLPPNIEQWKRLSYWSRLYIFILAWMDCSLPRISKPIHFGIVAGLCMIFLMTFMPHKPMAIPIIFGGGLSGAIIITGGIYAKTK